jgi:hypothetical protein
MRYRLRTLLILLAILPPLLAGAFFLLPMVPLGLSVRGMKLGFCVWLAVVFSAVALYFSGTRNPPSNT